MCDGGVNRAHQLHAATSSVASMKLSAPRLKEAALSAELMGPLALGPVPAGPPLSLAAPTPSRAGRCGPSPPEAATQRPAPAGAPASRDTTGDLSGEIDDLGLHRRWAHPCRPIHWPCLYMQMYRQGVEASLTRVPAPEAPVRAMFRARGRPAGARALL